MIFGAEIVSTSEPSLTVIKRGEDGEREARQTQEYLEQIVEAYMPQWARNGLAPESTLGLRGPVGEVGSESPKCAQLGEPHEYGGKDVSRPSLLGVSINQVSDYLREGGTGFHTRRSLLLLIFAVVALLSVVQWRVSRNSESTNLRNMLHLKISKKGGADDVVAPNRASNSVATMVNNIATGINNGQPDLIAEPLNNPSAPTIASSTTPSRNTIKPAMEADVSLSAGSFELRKGVQAGATAEGRTWLWRAMSRGNGEAPVLLADMYAQGNGVTKDCEQAVILLKAASKNANPHARSKMGSMYATGQCVPRDRVEAYRWMHSALQLNPASEWLQRIQKTLWDEMSAVERERAPVYR